MSNIFGKRGTHTVSQGTGIFNDVIGRGSHAAATDAARSLSRVSSSPVYVSHDKKEETFMGGARVSNFLFGRR